MHIEIPYNVRPRPDTGLYNAKLGIWLFLASEVMLFGALFSSLILLRSGVDHWPHGRDEGLNIPLASGSSILADAMFFFYAMWGRLLATAMTPAARQPLHTRRRPR